MAIIKPSTAFKAEADWLSADVRAYMKDQVATHVDTVQDVRDNDFELTRFLYVRTKAALYRLNLSSGAADDGDTVLRDNVGRRYEKVLGSVASLLGITQVDDLTARAAYDDEDEGFNILVSDTGDGRAAIYTMGDGGSADWGDPAYITGNDGSPGTGITWLGAWSAGEYDQFSAVENDGSAYVANTTTTEEPPHADWDLLAAAGDPGDPGAPGAPGADGDDGVSFIWRGAYDNGTAYDADDVVSDQDSSWIALQETTGNAPPSLPTTSNAYWELMAAKGADGAGSGSVTSVAITVPTGFEVSGSPITSSGTFGVTYASGYQGYTSAEASTLSTAVQPGDLGAVATSNDYDDLSNKPTLGNSSGLDVGTTAGTVAAGDDSRITGALQSANVATFTQYNSATADKVLETDSIWADLAVLTDGATIAVDFNDGYDFGGSSNALLLLGGNRTLGAPSNARNGKKGVLWFGATGSTRTLTLNAAWNVMDNVEAGPYSITTAQTLGVAYVCRGTTVYVTAILRIG